MTERNKPKKASSDPSTDTPLNPAEGPLADKQRELEGRRSEDQAGTAYFDVSEVDGLGSLTATAMQDEDELAAGVNDDLPGDNESLEMLTEQELRDGETDDPLEAIQEGLTYIPPIDPPTVPTETGLDGDARFANGFSVSALDEPYNADHHSELMPSDDEMTARVREAIRADSITTQYADHLAIATRNGIVTLRGMVDDLDDSDSVVAVAEYVEGVTEVIDEIEVRGM